MRFRKRHLWWLLAPVLVGILLLGFQYLAFYRQQAAIGHIEKLGGRVVTNHGEPGWIRWLIGGRSLRIFEQATLVNLSQTDINNADLQSLHRLHGLERLNLSGTGITDDGLRHLSGLTDLKALDLSGSRISGQGLEHLRNLTALEYLYLGRTKIADADLNHLEGLKSLRDLDVTETAVSDDGVAEIKRRLPAAKVKR